MMEIREATESDVTAIVDLLKRSLGESLMPKSELYWRWKHLQNPFGPSPVLLSWEAKTLVGVRAFMRWEWIRQDRLYKAVRAVDTATDPGHQGKGIFKRLTMQLLSDCKEETDFVFNTPNSQSKPGYLKMGWEEMGKLPITFEGARPLHMFKNLIFNSKPSNVVIDKLSLTHYLDHPSLDTLLSNHKKLSGKFTTNYSVEYLRWRYLDVPVATYVANGLEIEGKLVALIIGRIKKSKFGKELRITECFLSDERHVNELAVKFNETKKNLKVDFITVSATGLRATKKIMRLFNFTLKAGPIVTARKLKLHDLESLFEFKAWSPTLGDLELF